MSAPRLRPGVKLRQDPERGPILMAPERLLILDDIGRAILRQIDGTKDLAAILKALSAEYDAPEAEIETDVKAFLSELERGGYITQ